MDIYPNKAGKGNWTFFSNPENIFIDLGFFPLNNNPQHFYLTLSGTLARISIGTVVFHEFLHSYDREGPLVELIGSNYNDPDFDHFGSVVSRTNLVREEILNAWSSSNFIIPPVTPGYEDLPTSFIQSQLIHDLVNEGQRGSYIGTILSSDTESATIDYINSLGQKIQGQYDQAILFKVNDGFTSWSFTSEGKIVDGHDSRDLIISLQARLTNNTIRTGNGEDVIVGFTGEDTIYAGDGNDNLYGGYGMDVLHGEVGIDHLFGEQGNDELYGGKDNDFLYGGIDVDIYHIARSGDGIDTIADEDGLGLISLGGGDLIIGTAVPVSGGTDNKQLYELQNNNTQVIKLDETDFIFPG